MRRGERDPSYTVAYSACSAARQLDLAALVIPTLSGRSARIISAHRPQVPIYALSPGKETVRRCGLMWASGRAMRRHEVTEELIADAAARASREAGSSPAIASASPPACRAARRGRRACSRSSASSIYALGPLAPGLSAERHRRRARQIARGGGRPAPFQARNAPASPIATSTANAASASGESRLSMWPPSAV